MTCFDAPHRACRRRYKVWEKETFRPYIAHGELVSALDDWLPPFSGFFLYFPSRRTVTPKLRALIEHVCQRRSKIRPGGGANQATIGARMRPPGGRSPSGGLMRARRFSEGVSAGLSGSALGETIAIAVHLHDITW